MAATLGGNGGIAAVGVDAPDAGLRQTAAIELSGRLRCRRAPPSCSSSSPPCRASEMTKLSGFDLDRAHWRLIAPRHRPGDYRSGDEAGRGGGGGGPQVIDGRKFDNRGYVLVASLRPLLILYR